ncbi:hypothetical protein BGZ76_005095 [Entomortierella beljakovae]|nr:hypothetical protein BGZ76_005095 [Entomortierella beljakovae]
MAFSPPDPNVYYPIPPGQLPPGFVTPPPGTAVRGIPIVVPLGHEMLISPEGFPVFVPERTVPKSPYTSSPSIASNTTSPALTQKQHQPYQQGAPTPPVRHSTMISQHSAGHYPTPPPVPQPPTHISSPGHSFHIGHTSPAVGHPIPPGHIIPQGHLQQHGHILQGHVHPAPPAAAAPPGLTFASIVTSFRTSSESVSAWTFYSLGLNHNPGQKEIVITLRQRPSNYTLESVQPIMYQLFSHMNSFIQASGGKPLTAGEVFPCRLNTPDLGVLDMAVLLVHSPPECKASVENKDVLYGLIATLDEMAVFTKYGAARTMTNMGNDLETWPIPLWSDWSRPTLVSLKDFQGSVTEVVPVLPTKNIVATLDTITHRLAMVVSSAALELIQAELRKFPPVQPGIISEASRITFLLDLDAGAQAYLTWRNGQNGPAIFNARPNPTSFHGCWLTLSGISPYEEAIVPESISAKEDGIEIKMKGITWERLYQAMASRTPAIIPVGQETVHLNYA